jgi:hypothetical protein
LFACEIATDRKHDDATYSMSKCLVELMGCSTALFHARRFMTHGLTDRRLVFIHAGYVRPDQIPWLKAIGAIPSFLSISLYAQGEEIEPFLGKERTAMGMAAGSMRDQGVPFTLSHDAPVTPPQILPLVWSAVNRQTKAGTIIGPQERISAYEALRAVTATAASRCTGLLVGELRPPCDRGARMRGRGLVRQGDFARAQTKHRSYPYTSHTGS